MQYFNSKSWLILSLLCLLPVLYACQQDAPAPSGSVATDSEGATGSGQNDSLSNAIALGSLDAVAAGYIDEDAPGDVDFYTFTLTSSETVYFDIDFANDVNTPDTDDDDGLDSVISVFDSEGTLIQETDDIGFPPDPGSDPNGDYDPFLELDLEPGTYFVAISAWDNYSNGSSDGFDSEGGLSGGEYCLSVRTSAGQDAPATACR